MLVSLVSLSLKEIYGFVFLSLKLTAERFLDQRNHWRLEIIGGSESDKEGDTVVRWQVLFLHTKNFTASFE